MLCDLFFPSANIVEKAILGHRQLQRLSDAVLSPFKPSSLPLDTGRHLDIYLTGRLLLCTPLPPLGLKKSILL